jgi:ribosomal protein L18
VHAAVAQVIDDAAGRTLVAASTLTADVKGSVDGNGANIVSNSSAAEQQQQQQQRRQCIM